jgi:steroid 5-alpha reductase family enzyme
MSTTSKSRAVGFFWVTLSYIIGVGAGSALGYYLHLEGYHPLAVIGLADVLATLIVFFFSIAFKNSSFYDPYWSIIPVPIAFYLAWLGMESGADTTRIYLVVALVTAWAIRLTGNWARGWTGLDHEDWRYQRLAEASGKWYPIVNLTGIHYFPTLMVFLACIPLYPALSLGNVAFNGLDLLAALITATGILLELVADNQRYAFAQNPSNRGKTITTGLWAHSRHPNYLGEILFWIGLCVFGLASGVMPLWMSIGAIAMWAMFQFITLPMMEKRNLKRRPDYALVQQSIPRLFPNPFRKATAQPVAEEQKGK